MNKVQHKYAQKKSMMPKNQASLHEKEKHINKLPDKLINYCTPLLTQLGLKTFIFRSFEIGGNGSFYSTDSKFDSLILDNHLANSLSFLQETKYLPQDKLSFALWNNDLHAHEPYYKFFKDLNVWNGLNIYRRKCNHLEVYMFAGLDESINSGNFYLNNYELLSRFINFFLMKIETASIHTARFRFAFKDRLAEIFSNDNVSHEPSGLHSLPSSLTHNERALISTPNGDVILSQRESACLKLLSGGKTAKEIARSLSLSHRTIESYINNIRQKTGLRTRSELVDAFYKTSPFTKVF